MLSQNTYLHLSSLIHAISEVERQLETIRVDLAKQAVFEPYTSFQRIDSEKNKKISAPNIQCFLQYFFILFNSLEKME